MKFLEMLKKNWIGGVIGAYIGSQLFWGLGYGAAMTGQTGWYSGPYIRYVGMAVGYIVGAFIQSKFKRGK